MIYAFVSCNESTFFTSLTTVYLMKRGNIFFVDDLVCRKTRLRLTEKVLLMFKTVHHNS